jgi:L-iditol 2-dehydrogenase
MGELEVAKAIKDAAGMELRVALECTGFESSIRAGIFVSPSATCEAILELMIQSVKFGGKVFVIGVGPSEQKVRFPPLYR